VYGSSLAWLAGGSSQLDQTTCDEGFVELCNSGCMASAMGLV